MDNPLGVSPSEGNQGATRGKEKIFGSSVGITLALNSLNLHIHLFSNSNWTEWSTIQGVIARIISKSDEREARGRFEITSTITPWIVRHEVQLLVNRIYNKFRN